MKVFKYLIFIILTTLSIQTFADYEAYNSTGSAVASTAIQACVDLFNNQNPNFQDSASPSGNITYTSGSCYRAANSFATVRTVQNNCSSSEYFDVKGPQFYAGNTYCKNKCVRTIVPLNSYDFSTGGAITVDGMCNDSFTSCSGVSKNTGATCSADTSGWSDTSRGTAPPVDPKCKNYGTFNGQTVCVDSTQKGKAASSTNATGTGSGTGVGTTTSINSDGSQTTVTRNADGSSITTITRADGSKITIVASADGSSVTTSTTSTNTSNQPSTTTTTSTSTTTTTSTKNLDGTTVSVSTNTSGGSTGGTRGTSVSGGSSDSSGEGTTTSGGGDSGGGDDGGDGGDDGGGGNGVDLSGVIAAINAAKSAIVSAVDKVKDSVSDLGDSLSQLKDWLMGDADTSSMTDVEVPEKQLDEKSFSENLYSSSAQCPADRTLSFKLLGRADFTKTFSFQMLCDHLSIFGQLIMLVAYIYAARIVTRDS